MKELKTGNLLWNTIEELARKEHNVGDEFILTMIDLGHPHRNVFGTCKYRINNEKEKSYYEGTLTFDPYIND